jgi:glyoxylase-like metal-dependent hydrolase (beta-lactamase superfamily II)
VNGGDAYEVFAVRYATRTTVRSEVFLHYDHYGEPDAKAEMDYFFWVVRGGGRTVLVDCGFTPEVGNRRERTTLSGVERSLSLLGIAPRDVDQLVLTHGHYDHIGNLGLFPAAEVVMARREFEFWTGPFGGRGQFASLVETADLDLLRAAAAGGRLTRTEGDVDLAAGIRLLEVGGHTPGQLVVVVRTAEGEVVLASDAVHYYEEYERDRPFAVVSDLPAMYRAFDTIREIARLPGRSLVAGHDPLVMDRFPAGEDDLAGVVVRVG